MEVQIKICKSYDKIKLKWVNWNSDHIVTLTITII